MKIYSLYEFSSTIEQLEALLKAVDMQQKMDYDEALDLVRRIFGKRPSRTKILLKSFIKLGLLQGKSQVILSWESQLYVDLGKDLTELLLFLTYKTSHLFSICKDICEIDPDLVLKNPELLEKLYMKGYAREKLATGREKIYAIKRLISCCRIKREKNPFKKYEEYINFLTILESQYLLMTQGIFGKPVVICDLMGRMKESGIERAVFDHNIFRLHYDPIIASSTSFSSVIKDFANAGYYKINQSSYYYLKLSESLAIKRR